MGELFVELSHGPSVIIGSEKYRYINGLLVVGKRYSS